jgi:hypothetical protein
MCENSACVNPRHLVALSPDAHRAWHATKDKALRERICAGEWEQIQAAKAEAARLEREQRLGQERQRLEEQELARRREKRTEQFDWIFSRLRNGWKLREQAIENDEAWSALRWAYLNRAITHDHVQLFCDTYTGKDEDMIPALLRSPRPNAIQAAGVRIKDLCYSVLYCVLFLVFVTPLVLIVQAVLFRANLQSALVWALLILALSIVIDLRKGTAGARLRTALREDNALFRGPPGLSPQSPPNAAGPAPGPPIVPGKRVHAFNIWVWLVGIGLLLMVGYFSQNKSVPKRYLSKESASAWTPRPSPNLTVSPTMEVRPLLPPVRIPTPGSTPLSTMLFSLTPAPQATAMPTLTLNLNAGSWPNGRMLNHPEHFTQTYVVNVAQNDTLKLRSGPGTKFPAIAEIPGDATGVSAFDQDQIWDGDTWWCPVEWKGLRGYVSRSYLPK